MREAKQPSPKKRAKKQSILGGFVLGAILGLILSLRLINALPPDIDHSAIYFEVFGRTVGAGIGMALVAAIYNLSVFRRR